MVQRKNQNNRVGKKLTRPARNVNLVVTAMRNLGNANGSTVGNIVEYITGIAEKPASKREILMALKRGVEFGLMDQKRGRYFFPEEEKKRLRQSEMRNHRVRSESSQLLERGLRIQSRNSDEVQENKSKDGRRRRKKKKSSKKSTGRKSVKKTRFARSLKSHELSDFYENPSYKASAVSSIDSLEYWQGEKRRYWK